MPNNPNTWTTLIGSFPPWFSGVLMAIFISILRVIYDRSETSFGRIILESLICGSLTLAAGSAANALGYPDWNLFIGGVIGFMGSQSIRALANRIIDKKIK